MNQKLQPITSNAPANLNRLFDAFDRWLYLPDHGAIEAVLATVAANRMSGDPLWLLLVGASGCGKTETLRSLDRLPNVHFISTFTEAGLLSGTPKKEAHGSGGLLRRIGTRGIIVLSDLGSILSMRPEHKSVALAALREIYDGHWTRELGSDGGRDLEWSGKCGLIAASTDAVYGQYASMSSLGERFIVFRMPKLNYLKMAAAAIDHAGHEDEMRAELAGLVFEWHQKLAVPDNVLTEDRAFAMKISSFCAMCRGSVERNRYHRDIESTACEESPGRLARQLIRFSQALSVIGVEREERLRLLRKTALDSLTPLRRRVVEQVAFRERQATEKVASAINLPLPMVRRELENLEILEVVSRDRTPESSTWSLTLSALTLWLGFPQNTLV